MISLPCFAQRKVALEISHVGNDPGGVTVVAELREALRLFESPPEAQANKVEAVERYGIRLTSGVSSPRIKLQLLTTAMESGAQTAVAINVTYDSLEMPLGGAFIRGMFETCGRNETAACAKRILLKTATAVDWFRDNWPSLWRTL
ncbi:MAG: hypothetical protein ACXWC0_18580 [Burkholderiales bacterium]